MFGHTKAFYLQGASLRDQSDSRMTLWEVSSHLWDATRASVFVFMHFLSSLQWSIIAGFCFCKDAPTVEIDVRQQFLKEVMDLCPRGRMDRCLCSDNSKIMWPFTQFDVINCGPKKVINTMEVGNCSQSTSLSKICAQDVW